METQGKRKRNSNELLDKVLKRAFTLNGIYGKQKTENGKNGKCRKTQNSSRRNLYKQFLWQKKPNNRKIKIQNCLYKFLHDKFVFSGRTENGKRKTENGKRKISCQFRPGTYIW